MTSSSYYIKLGKGNRMNDSTCILLLKPTVVVGQIKLLQMTRLESLSTKSVLNIEKFVLSKELDIT